MPNYTFRNNETNEEYTLDMKMSEREEYLENNPHIEQLIVSVTPLLDSHRLGVSKVPSGFNNLMKRVKKANRGSTIRTGNITEL